MTLEKTTNLTVTTVVGLLLTSGAYSRLFAEEPTFEEMAGEKQVGLWDEDDVQTVFGELDGDPPDPDTMEAFKEIDLGADVTVFFCTGCRGTQREFEHFLHLVDNLEGEVPFSRIYVGVNEEGETEPMSLLTGKQVLSLPTFLVTRGEKEVGRIVERSPRGLETDLGLLLDGSSRGLVSASEDVIRQYLSSDRGSAPPETTRSSRSAVAPPVSTSTPPPPRPYEVVPSDHPG